MPNGIPIRAVKSSGTTSYGKPASENGPRRFGKIEAAGVKKDETSEQNEELMKRVFKRIHYETVGANCFDHACKVN